jgi:hypothetical protein
MVDFAFWASDTVVEQLRAVAAATKTVRVLPPLCPCTWLVFERERNVLSRVVDFLWFFQVMR